MLLGLIIIGVLMYVAFYFAFSSFTSSNPGSSGAAMTAYEKIQNLVFKMPASLPMMILKIALILMIIYGIYDFTTATIRRTRLRRDQAQRKADLHNQLHGDGKTRYDQTRP